MTESAAERWPDAFALAGRLVQQTGDSVRVVLMYGSRLWRTNPGRRSALDFVVIVDEYRSFYSGLSRARELHRPVALMTALARVLAPNVISYTPDGGRGSVAKCLLVSKADFARAMGANPPDHFLLGRMVQRLGTVWTADASEQRWVQEQINGAHMRVLEWMAPYLHEPVDAAGLGRRLLEVCYSGELRPESKARPGRVFEAQAEHFATVLEPALEAAAVAGRMQREGDAYALTGPVTDADRRRWRWHFRRSKARTTMRLFKHTVTFANWLPYLVHKVERHTGRSIDLTFLERKLPIVFLWPRVIRVLLTKPREEIEE